jgi:hypothetical protein
MLLMMRIYIFSNFCGGLTAGTAITTAQFTLGSTASDSSDRFIYNQDTGLCTLMLMVQACPGKSKSPNYRLA